MAKMDGPRSNGASGLPGTPRGRKDKENRLFPKLMGSHIRTSPRWTFNSGVGQSAMEKQAANAPGPGEYITMSPDVTSRFQKGPNFSFGSSGRDSAAKQKIPGPGAYTLVKEPGATARSWTMSPRRQLPGNKLDAPGPGQHDIKALLGQAPRYSTGRRLDPSGNKVQPGPGDYSTVDSGTKTPSYGFGSSNRPDNSGSAHLATPGPGAYMVASTVGGGVSATIKGRHVMQRRDDMPGPGGAPPHGGHYSSFG